MFSVIGTGGGQSTSLGCLPRSGIMQSELSAEMGLLWRFQGLANTYIKTSPNKREESETCSGFSGKSRRVHVYPPTIEQTGT
jgi:hypothetical protein